MNAASDSNTNSVGLCSIYQSKCNQLENVLLRFFEQFQITSEKLFDKEANAFECIHHLDNHINQMRVCQSVKTTELPTNLDGQVKDGLLTKIYFKILWYIDKLKQIEVCCQKEAKYISTISFECIRVTNQIPLIRIESQSPEQNESLHLDPNETNDNPTKSNITNLICLDEIQKPTTKRISLIQLLEYTSRINIMLTQYASQIHNGLKSISFLANDMKSSHAKSESCDDSVECPRWINQLYPLRDVSVESPEKAEQYKTLKNNQEKTVGNLAFHILKQSIVGSESDLSDNSSKNETYETKEGKELKEAFTFPLKHKVEIQKIIFETTFFTQSFKNSKNASKRAKSKN